MLLYFAVAFLLFFGYFHHEKLQFLFKILLVVGYLLRNNTRLLYGGIMAFIGDKLAIALGNYTKGYGYTTENKSIYNIPMVQFKIHNHIYKILLKRPKSLRRDIVVDIRGTKNGLTKNIYRELSPFLGPHDNFFGMTYTPTDFGYDFITVSYLTLGTKVEETFSGNQSMTVNIDGTIRDSFIK